MTRNFTESYMYGWRPGEHSENVRYADYVFKGEDIRFVELSERANDLKDTASVEIHNPGGKYSSSEAAGVLQHGDRVEFQTRYDRNLRPYGSGKYGTGLYQPELRIRWTGIIRNYQVTADGRGQYTLEFDAEDFAYAVMSMRRVTNAWEREQIVSGPGSGQGIINTILENECPELDLSELPEYAEETTISLPDKNVLEVIVELANRLGAVLWAEGTTVRLAKPEDIATRFDLSADDYTLYTFRSNDDEMFNRIRVEGGRSHELHEEQTTQDGWTTVTKDTRATQQISTRKSEVDRVEIWTDPNRTGAEEELVVRLQADDGNGNPIAPESTRSDIARKRIPHHFLAADGFTTFNFPEHDLPDYEPWLIVESSGEVGHDIGIRTSDGSLTYRSHYPYPIRVRRDEPRSQEQYRLREDTLNDDTVEDLGAARDMGDATLDRTALPDRELELDAESERLHNLSPGEVIRLDLPQVDATGRYVCVDRTVEWEQNLEYAQVTVRDLASL